MNNTFHFMHIYLIIATLSKDLKSVFYQMHRGPEMHLKSKEFAWVTEIFHWIKSGAFPRWIFMFSWTLLSEFIPDEEPHSCYHRTYLSNSWMLKIKSFFHCTSPAFPTTKSAQLVFCMFLCLRRALFLICDSLKVQFWKRRWEIILYVIFPHQNNVLGKT